MAKKAKNKSPKPDSPKGGGEPSKPNLLKRIVKTIESISKDRKGRSGESKARKAAEASRRQSLDQAAEDLGAPAEPVESASRPAPAMTADSGNLAAEEPKSMTAPKKKSGAKGGKSEEVKDSKKSKPIPNSVITIPPVSSVYAVEPADASLITAKSAKFDIEPPHAHAARRPLAPIALDEPIFSTRLVLLVRDPETLYAYWDISNDDRASHRLDSLVPPRHLSLRLYDHGREPNPSAHAHLYVDFLLQTGVDSRYLRLPMKDRWWRADLGVKDEITGFTVLARSNTVRSPRDQVAEWGPEKKGLSSAQTHAPAVGMGGAPAAPSSAVAENSPTREQVFSHTFRLSGGMRQGLGGGEVECVESTVETRRVLRVRPAGSSGTVPSEEDELFTTLKVRRVGASDLSSRQG